MGISYAYTDSDNDNTTLIQNGEIAIRPNRNFIVIHDYGWRFYLSLIGLTLIIFTISILFAFLFNYLFYKKTIV